ncbi:hypothetical protein [Adhaeretor mobilis]|uniref:Uncharacterized protein n=1 Tax=Adhaeretor mobilis TaxID=1930276 RepID=A0A517MT94_9BACT|nr:hypothetical protein [Adhaeretor mobilis]QDS98111.1 hypothetical protein HG15A2_13830 [Adhaeretor mobilis]
MKRPLRVSNKILSILKSCNWQRFRWLASGLLVLTLVAFAWTWQALQEVDPFYTQAVSIQPPKLRVASEELRQRVASLVDDTQRPAPWSTAFSQGQINGWLAISLVAQYAEQIPTTLSDPRIAFENGRILLGLRYREGKINTVVTVVAVPEILDADMLSIRLESAHAGSLPISTKKISQQVATAAEKMRIPLAWTEREGAPVALFPLAAAISSVGQRRQLETLEIADGTLRVAGRTSLTDPAKRLASQAREVKRR